MRTLSSIVPNYADRVDTYVVAFNESGETIDNYIADQEYSNMIAAAPVGTMLADLKIVSQSSMIAVNGAGVITFRKGYGRGGDEATLRGQFELLAQ